MKTATALTVVAHATPALLRSKHDYYFDPRSDIWDLSRDVRIDFDWTYGYLTPEMAGSFRKALSSFAVQFSPSYTSNIFQRFKAFAIKITGDGEEKIGALTATALINYRAQLSEKNDWYCIYLKVLINKLSRLGLPGLDDSVHSTINEWAIKGNETGRAVRTRDPDAGALTEFEFHALDHALLDALEDHDIDLDEFVLCKLFQWTGRRPSQIGDLKNLDLVRTKDEAGIQTFILRVPRRKDGQKPRSDFRDFALAPESGEFIVQFQVELFQRLSRLFPGLSKDDFVHFPFFPNWSFLEDFDGTLSQLVQVFKETDAGHCKTRSIAGQLSAILDRLEIHSERTGTLDVFPVRLRRTLATRAAELGYGSLLIAEMLDHLNDRSARVYTERRPDNVTPINAAMERQLFPIVQAFSGTLVRRERDAVRGDDPTSRIRDNDGAGVGTCGKFSFCGALAPIACYTCRNFQPWLEGPHRELLDLLLRERARIDAITGSAPITKINDITISAVKEVIRMCDEVLAKERPQSESGDAT